ncbi:type II toxin-antitoxin system RelE/ParE family toxin [uncultured Polaribacter sp.]|uniref:type II toxin-antitoxin system RelE/ParE family toxin n=1 Tax=uncultured Polaribacter sp. TaxID=174711 RepID=UPI0026186371|nr:type II toxin-antitoxin system RelE/ParE family toxin [uncultured Polaribacter sp.]
MEYFKAIFLESVDDFIKNLDFKIQKKIFYNIRLAEKSNDPKIFKKLTDEIWEFRIRFSNKQIRLLSFWDKRNNNNTLVIATNGFIKKTQKTPKAEINKAKRIMNEYLKD